ncbi:MAG TPA: sugar phosphate nucleotidyltransferase [Gammaproteobacteria bacterium]|nr:sugar phosphate nucleotidyltransferase [Gammaproteobacteria bacterium]
MHFTDLGNGKTWAIVLAAGDGTRLRALTANRDGVAVPKQYCSLRAGPSLLREALRRAFRLVPRARTCAVVAAQHSRWWNGRELAASHFVVQPENRGTANGILLALVRILARDPEARVVVLPADHHVADERVLAQSMSSAVAALVDERADIVMLGMTPERVDPGLGYIEPDGLMKQQLVRIGGFVEKPTRVHATKLIEAGALWNTFIVAANGRKLLEVLRAREPSVVSDMQRCAADVRAVAPSAALRELYRELPVVDFSRDVAQENPTAFHALRVPACGWSDLGTVDRVREALQRGGRSASAPDAVVDTVSLARALWSERLPAHAVCDLTDELGVRTVEVVPAR